MNRELPRKAWDFLAKDSEPRAVFDTGGVLRAGSDALFRIVGWRREEMTGRYVWDFVDAESIGETLAVLDHVSLAGGVKDFVNCFRRRDRQRVWLCWNCGRADEYGLLYATAQWIEAPPKLAVA